MSNKPYKYEIEKEAVLTEELLNAAYEELEMGGDLYIQRKEEWIDFQKEGISLIKAGFIHIVQMKKTGSGSGCTIHCVKGERREKLLSVIIPLYNEEATAETLLDRLIRRSWPLPVEFVIVESNSADRTRDIARSFEKLPGVRLILEDEPHGKGNAVLKGIEHASGNYIAIQDGDLEYDVEDYDRLLVPIIEDRALFVLGSRYRKDDWHMRKFSGRRAWLADYLNVGQTLLTALLNAACHSRLSDPFTMYKIFHRDCMYGIRFVGGNFGLDWELVIRFLRKGYVPAELPVSYQARSFEEGKHIALFKTPLEGLKMLWHCRYASEVYDYGDE
ncbi:MAG: glycosyltransferase family 2 protein [Lachnospiraceae bacterium]|nr:glycosyltransferase family 2 protein [Lachnospiraceae bacterium]